MRNFKILKLYATICYLLLVLFPGTVNAEVQYGDIDKMYSNTQTSVNGGNSVLMCYYGSGTKAGVEIFYNYDTKNWSIYGVYGNKRLRFMQLYTESLVMGAGGTINDNDYYEADYKTLFSNHKDEFGDDGTLFYNNKNDSFSSTVTESKFQCPTTAVLEADGYVDVCLTNLDISASYGALRCNYSEKFDDGVVYYLQNNEKSYEEKLVNAQIAALNSIFFSDLKDIDDLDKLIDEKTKENLTSKELNAPFFENYMQNLSKNPNKEYVEARQKFSTKMTSDINSRLNRNMITKEEADYLKGLINGFSDKTSKDVLEDKNNACGYKFDPYKKDNEKFSSNCLDIAPTLRTAGIILLIVKILLPLVLILKATFDLGMVATKGSADETRKYFSKLIKNIVAAIIVFLVPTIMNIAFSLVDKYNENMTDDSIICRECIFSPNSDTCINAATYCNVD